MSDESTDPWHFDFNKVTDERNRHYDPSATNPRLLYASVESRRLTRESYYGMQDLVWSGDENLLSRYSNSHQHRYRYNEYTKYNRMERAVVAEIATCTDSPGILFPGVDFWGWYLGLLDVLSLVHQGYVSFTEIDKSWDNDITLKNIVVSIVQSSMKGNYSDHQIECIAQTSFTGAITVNELLAFLGLVVFKYDPLGGKRLALLETLEVSPHRKYSAVSEVLKVTIPVLKGYNTKMDMTSSSYDRFRKVFFSQMIKNESWLGRTAEEFVTKHGEDYFRFIHHLRVDYPFEDEVFAKTEVEDTLKSLSFERDTGGTCDHGDDTDDYVRL